VIEPAHLSPRTTYCVLDVLGRPLKRGGRCSVTRVLPPISLFDWRALAGLSRQDVERTPGVGVAVLREMDEWLAWHDLEWEDDNG
jgi:hypothetical protein